MPIGWCHFDRLYFCSVFRLSSSIVSSLTACDNQSLRPANGEQQGFGRAVSTDGITEAGPCFQDLGGVFFGASCKSPCIFFEEALGNWRLACDKTGLDCLWIEQKGETLLLHDANRTAGLVPAKLELRCLAAFLRKQGRHPVPECG